jgi:hypothetical protein
MASRHQVTTVAVKTDIHRLRKCYTELLHEEVGRTVSYPAEIDEEIHALCEALTATEGRLVPWKRTPKAPARAFKKTIAEYYPGIEIVAEQGIREPEFYGDAERAASIMLTTNQNLNGIWAVWDLLAEGVLSAARVAGRDDLVITTIDLGLNIAVEMAGNGLVKGLGAQLPYDQGVTEALLAGYGLLGKTAPAYVALPALPVTRENLLDAWKTVYHTEAPASIKDRMK